MKPLWVALGIAGAAGLALAVTAPAAGGTVIGANPSDAWKSVHGLPLPPGWTPASYQAAIAKLKPYGEPPADIAAVYAYLQARWAERRKLLPKDARPWQDGYATEHFLVAPVPYPMGGPFASASANVDQFGRPAEAPAGQGGGDPLGSLLTTAGMVLPYVPGIGPEAAAAIAVTIALGKGKSLKDAALAGIRASLPVPAQVAFDMGVGVVLEHKSLDSQAKAALLKEIPGGEQAYRQGVELAKKVKA